MQVRQGDVLLEKIEELPTGLKPIKRQSGRIIIAAGEATGHHHAISDRRARLFGDDEGNQYLAVDAPVALRHEEHGAIELEPGNYRHIRQREYSPTEIRRVID